MKKLTIDDYVVEEKCGPLTIQYRIQDFRPYKEDRVSIEWYVCPDDEDKNHERAFYAGEISGDPKNFDALAAGAIDECRAAVIAMANDLISWAQQQLHRSALQVEVTS